MKKSLLLRIPISVLVLLLVVSSLCAQSIWNNIPLVGAEAKIVPTAKSQRFNVSFIGAFPLGDVPSENVPFADLQKAAFTPGTFEQLFERLGGEFFIGNPSGQPSQSVEMSGTTSAMPGLRLGVRVGKRFEIRAGGQYFQTKWSGTVPVLVMPPFPHDPPQPKTLQGTLSAASSGILAEADLAFFFTEGRVRPYMRGGVRGQFPMQGESGAEIAGVALPLEIEPLATEFSPFGGAGLRWNVAKNIFVEAGASYGKVSGNFVPSAEFGIGWAF
ncbi:MAG: hypothetical protein KIS77_13045 [Saprospiraceae bacterium]|nr:hypothetical protein [Saprospiraceae bacterium]